MEAPSGAQGVQCAGKAPRGRDAARSRLVLLALCHLPRDSSATSKGPNAHGALSLFNRF